MEHHFSAVSHPRKKPLEEVISGKCRIRSVTLAEACRNDGQRLLAFNDLFLGAQTHVSARYRIRWAKAEEPQSSSGVRQFHNFHAYSVGYKHHDLLMSSLVKRGHLPFLAII